MVLLARVSSNPPSPVPLLQTSQVWVPVCFRMDTGMGLGPWALALGGAWAFALGAPSHWPWHWHGVSLERGCWDELGSVCLQAPATFPNVRDPTARLPSSPTRFIQRLL